MIADRRFSSRRRRPCGASLSRRWRAAAGGFLGLAAVFLAAPASAQRFPADSFTLDNGLQVVVLPNHRVPAVTVMVWYKIGAADDPVGKSGTAHFLEHLMFKGTAAVPAGGFAAAIARLGGRDNAFTTQDATAFYETVPRDDLDLVLRLEADRMTGLAPEDRVVQPEHEVVLEERRSRIDNEPAALLAEQLRAATFLHHPYRNPAIGWEGEVRRLDAADALDFYRRWYAPNNAILIVAGDVDADRVRGLAESRFAPLPARDLPSRSRVEEPEHHAAVRVEMKSPRVGQPSWSRVYIAPSYRSGETKYAYALQILAELLGGGANSRFYRTLVLQRGLAVSVSAGYQPGALDLATFWIYATPKPGVAVADLEAAIDAELKQLLRDGVDADEVRRAAARMRAAATYDRDSLSGPARIVGAALATGRTLEDVEAWPDRIGAVTAADVESAARAVLIERNSATGLLLPEPTS